MGGVGADRAAGGHGCAVAHGMKTGSTRRMLHLLMMACVAAVVAFLFWQYLELGRLPDKRDAIMIIFAFTFVIVGNIARIYEWFSPDSDLAESGNRAEEENESNPPSQTPDSTA